MTHFALLYNYFISKSYSQSFIKYLMYFINFSIC